MPTDSNEGKKIFHQLAQETLDTGQPGRYNQAIMDFGATQCTPQAPDCKNCPLQSNCVAFQQNLVEKLPVKAKKLVKRERFFSLSGHRMQCKNSSKKNVLQGYLAATVRVSAHRTTSDNPAAEHLQNNFLWKNLLVGEQFELKQVSKPFKQTLTHQVIHAVFFEIELQTRNRPEDADFIAIERKNLSKFAFPKIIDWYLQDNSLYLNLL